MVGIYEVSRWSKVNARRAGQERSHARKLNIHVISDGITRLPILEGEISHIELPRESSPLGLTIVGGADTPLRCVVVQEVFSDCLVALDGRLQPGDQIIEVDGIDMTTATHQQVCDALRKSSSVLRLGVYRERIDAYRASPSSVLSSSLNSSEIQHADAQHPHYYELPNSRPRDAFFPESTGRGSFEALTKEENILIPLQRHTGKHLGIKLGSRKSEPGIFIVEISPESIAGCDNRLRVQDRVLCINGEDVRYAQLEFASNLIQRSRDYVNFIVSRSSNPSPAERSHSLSQDSLFGYDESDPSLVLSGSSNSSDRTSECSAVDEDQIPYNTHVVPPLPPDDIPSIEGDEKQRKRFSAEVEPPSFMCKQGQVRWPSSPTGYETNVIQPKTKNGVVSSLSQVFGRKKNEAPVLHQKQVRLVKRSGEGLGMRIGGGLSSNEGDTPIYVANINHHGTAGKSRQVKKGDVVLSVDGQSLLGLTHSQAVALLKATSAAPYATLTLLEGPETGEGPTNFVPSWLYWQRLPKSLHIPKNVVLHRPPGASLGFSIVGGSDPQRGPEPIHVLFVVSTSPAALDGRLRCGDRLLAVDGHCLENVSHSTAVSLLKQAGQRVTLEVVSWMGTEL